MQNIIPKDSRYIPIVQQPWCCVPACISMVMHRYKIPLISQELLGYYLGLVVPKKDAKYFWKARTGKKPPAGYGTRIYIKKYHPNSIFPRLRIPLRMIFYPIDKYKNISDFKNYLISVERLDKNILACFHYKKLYGSGNDGGHLSVVDRVYLNKNKIRLIDPARSMPKWRVVSIAKLKKAMDCHHKGSAGFWEFI
ncbi:MAG: hypothetical protein ABIE43_01810 [Patescibacteria group bacterium]